MALSLSIVNNFPSIVAQNNLNKSAVGLAQSLERLSSGLKINRGADGPSALVVSERLRNRTASLEKVIENTEKDAAVIQIAEGGLDNINSLLIKARQLALDSANTATNDAATFAANQQELDNILLSIDQAAANTRFGSKGLLNGESGLHGVASNSNVTFLRAALNVTLPGQFAVTVTTAGDKASVIAPTNQTGTLTVDEVLTINGVAIQLNAGMSKTDVQNTINAFTSQTGVVANNSSTAGGATRLQAIDFGDIVPGTTAALADITVVSNIAPTASSSGFASTTATDNGVDIVGTINLISYTGRGNILTANTGVGSQAGISLQFLAGAGLAGNSTSNSTVSGALGNINITDNTLVFQVGADIGQTAKVAVDKLDTGALGLDVFAGGTPGVRNQFTNLKQVRITSLSRANDAIKVIDDAIDRVTKLRGSLGAVQRNALELNVANIRNQVSNQIAADSIIRDTDYAFEISRFTKFQVLVQAGTSVLGNANAVPQLALALLQG